MREQYLSSHPLSVTFLSAALNLNFFPFLLRGKPLEDAHPRQKRSKN